MKDKILHFISNLMLIFIIFLPKISIINIPNTYVGIRLDDILILLFTLIYFFSGKFLKVFKKKNTYMKRIIFVFIVYIIFSFISAINGIINKDVNYLLSFLYLMRKIEYFVLIFVGYDFIENKKNKTRLFKLIDFSVIYHFIVIILQKNGIIGGFIDGRYISNITMYRATSTFNGSYELSVYLLLILPLFLIRIFKEKDNIKLSILNVFLIISTIFLSQSRTSTILLLFLSILVAIYCLKDIIVKQYKKNKIKMIGIVTIMLIIITGLSFGILPRLERFKTLNINKIIETIEISWKNKDYERLKSDGYYIEMENGTDLSFSIRINKWFALIDGVLDRPLFGLGPSVSKEACDGNYIRIFAETGIIGLILWIILLLLINNLKITSLLSSLVKFGMISLALTAIFIDIFEASKIMMFYWFVIGCTVFENSYKLKSTKSNKRCSVVMATYNGETYIKNQIDSILNNLNSNDELIISDDGSNDNTINIIKEYQKKDNRITLVNGPKNGVKQNFANAISKASGKYIFLADQDDVWTNNKIRKVLSIFQKENCQVVIHNADIVDENLKLKDKTFFEFRNSKSGISKNIIKNSYIGCCMAFDSSLKDLILPIPNNIEMHDQWIGLIGEKYGKSLFIDDCLIKYRRHDNNVSSMKHYSILKMIKNRLVFICKYFFS